MHLFTVFPENYKLLELKEGESYASYNCLRWNGQPKKSWRAPPVQWLEDEFTDSTDMIGDFTAFGGGRIALSSQALEVLKPHVGDQAEFLPTTGPESSDCEWWLLNVLNVLDIMDTSKSKFEIYHDGEVGSCSHAFLNEPDTGNKIFLVRGYFPDIFVSDDTKALIESSGLSGGLIRQYVNP